MPSHGQSRSLQNGARRLGSKAKQGNCRDLLFCAQPGWKGPWNQRAHSFQTELLGLWGRSRARGPLI